ncbi:hypothetical protein LEP1GSC016_3092 [Leptospira borgpetersenii serovar Hardjo-bovis str. Sponselee]|uniref:Uncharacterized protein n=4 Tax=Leptospira borgpetersenii TaxID=174 RepID=M3HHV5_LEPBO|nr:hypothetical protein LEP1GSC101_1012 [Leptospira borgpetersenii str. UI 09149]EKR01140.1 hypothetical protein LEP1GSC121_1558 [Leptospira borgpetersenii serovar Castellonis str. 200801910]EMF97690.1 hypothetical protein LEP1GSC123_1150 [Leptospira borgpetersenii str. 200701203]EMJ78075.1 hypothetical protein LEP1GSC016_3092 [Leptospira borgpetersenii serovar Hardjo-bovis str. Sponselee]EMK08391.1 hypothetical protein LEP1GSC066_1027 [Leptospira sp. serovar Kenya str. Sh9]EMN11447.1 hypothet
MALLLLSKSMGARRVFAEIRARIKIWVKFYQHILKYQ